MTMRKIAVATMLVALTSVAPQFAGASTQIVVDTAPPALRVEAVPAPRHGYAWSPGYWQWSHKKYEWRAGTWIRDNPGHHWVAHDWEHRDGRYYYRPGHWDRD
jgi:hypothetical protein